MIGFIFALLAGFLVALSDALNKKYFSDKGTSYMVFARTVGSLPFLLPLFLYLTFFKGVGVGYFSPQFMVVVGILLGLETLATFLYMKGIKVSPLSVSVPFLSFTPVFIILTGYFLLGEKVSFEGAMGILLVVAGSYVINFPSARLGWLEPIKAIKKEKGSFLLLQVALIYSITSVLGKKGLLLTDPLWFSSFYFTLLGISAGLVVKVFYQIEVGSFLKTQIKGIFLVGLTQALMCYCHMIALSQLETAYMIALKRTSILFSVVLGYFFFKESYFGLRLVAAGLMLTGVCLIMFFK